MPVGDLHTTRTWQESLTELRDEMRKWSIEDYLLPTLSESRTQGEVRFAFAVGGKWTNLKCSMGPSRWQGFDAKTSIRAIVMAVSATRKMDQRGLGSLLAETAKHLALSPGNGEIDPYKVLGVDPQADKETIRSAYLRLLKDVHPDVPGGSREAYDRVHKAAEDLEVA